MKNFIDIKIEGINASISIVSVTGHESISDEFSFNLLLSTPINEPLKPEDCLKQPLTIFYNEANSTYKKFGIITSLQLVFSSDPHNLQFRLACQSSLGELKSITRSNIYTEKTPIEVISEVLNKYNHINYFISCANALPKKSFIHQYKESDCNFIGRLCEHWGIHYYFDNDEENTLTFADDRNYQASEKIFHFIENPNTSQVEHAITALNMQQTPAINHVTVEGRNPEQDSIIITTEFGKPNDDHSSIKFNGIGIDNEDEGLLIAQRRYELQQCQNIIYTGSSTAQDIRAGFTIKIDMGNNQEPLELLIISVDYTASNLNLIRNEDAIEFNLTFSAIPANIVFRPALLKPIPTAISSTARIFSSFENASIAHRDNLGRYKVIFDYMDNQQASHWMRKSQTAGKDNHLDIPLLPNTEVQIAYLGGNPDLPYISCALENSQSTIIPSNNERPYATCLHTSGKLSLEAGRSFNLSIVAPMDKQSTVNPATPSNIVTQFSSTATVGKYNRLNNNGIKFPNDERLNGDNIEYNVDALQGQTYKVQDTVSFVLG
ncbi:type VI secretion system Vgr family protein [Pseudomonas sp. HK3]